MERIERASDVSVGSPMVREVPQSLPSRTSGHLGWHEDLVFVVAALYVYIALSIYLAIHLSKSVYYIYIYISTSISLSIYLT